MQQTQTYKLNKPEMSDPFSPAPLSENMDTVDATLADHEQRVVALEGCRIALGWYRGQRNGTTGTSIDLGEQPAAVLVIYNIAGHGVAGIAMDGTRVRDTVDPALKLTDTGFWVGGYFDYDYEGGYCYIAFFGDWPRQNIPDPPPAA